jgi:hypothetical protein
MQGIKSGELFIMRKRGGEEERRRGGEGGYEIK